MQVMRLTRESTIRRVSCEGGIILLPLPCAGRLLARGRGGRDICPEGRFVIWWTPYPSSDEAFLQPRRCLLFVGEMRLRADFIKRMLP